MTCILAIKGQMVTDSKVSIGAGISYPTKKAVKCGDMVVGAAGHSGDCTRFIEWAQEGFKPKNKPKFEATGDDTIDGLVVKKDGIYYFCPSYPAPERIEAEFFAVGSGGKAARVAMLMGATPVQAVELACQVDDYTGPPVTVYTLED